MKYEVNKLKEQMNPALSNHKDEKQKPPAYKKFFNIFSTHIDPKSSKLQKIHDEK